MPELAKCPQMSILSQSSLQLGVAKGSVLAKRMFLQLLSRSHPSMEAVCTEHGKGNLFFMGWKLESTSDQHEQRQDPVDGSATTQRNLGPLRPYGKELITALDLLSLRIVMWERKELPFYLSCFIYESRCYSSLTCIFCVCLFPKCCSFSSYPILALTSFYFSPFPTSMVILFQSPPHTESFSFPSFYSFVFFRKGKSQ